MKQEKDGNNEEEKEALFYDTYALYAIATGKESYKEFAKDYTIVTSLMNLYEFYYISIKEKQNEIAEKFFNRLLDNCSEIKAEHVKEAARFRFKEIKKKLSYLDCLGYVIAKANNVKFLTGDAGFKDIGNVRFVI